MMTRPSLPNSRLDSAQSWLMAALAFVTCLVVFDVVYSFGAFFKTDGGRIRWREACAVLAVCTSLSLVLMRLVGQRPTQPDNYKAPPSQARRANAKLQPLIHFIGTDLHCDLNSFRLLARLRAKPRNSGYLRRLFGRIYKGRQHRRPPYARHGGRSYRNYSSLQGQYNYPIRSISPIMATIAYWNSTKSANPRTNFTANAVFGQGGSFISNTCDMGDVSANSLCNPHKLISRC
jgi:hypothetical protein